jgi:hypothetical protein
MSKKLTPAQQAEERGRDKMRAANKSSGGRLRKSHAAKAPKKAPEMETKVVRTPEQEAQEFANFQFWAPMVAAFGTQQEKAAMARTQARYLAKQQAKADKGPTKHQKYEQKLAEMKAKQLQELGRVTTTAESKSEEAKTTLSSSETKGTFRGFE